MWNNEERAIAYRQVKVSHKRISLIQEHHGKND